MKEKVKRSKSTLGGWLLSAPYLIYTIVFFLIPLIWAFWISMMDWNLMSDNKKFVGLNNFIRLFSDNRVKMAFMNSYKYMIAIVVLCTIFSIIVALIVHSLPNKVKGVAAVLLFIPYLTSGVAVSVIVKFFFSYNSAFNIWLRARGVEINWFQDPKIAFWIIIGIIVWKMSGYYALFVLSALEGINDDVNEAAALDGCTGIRKFFRITLPMILPTLITIVTLAAGLGFGIFTEPYLLTGGGPSLATTTWQLEIYNASFTQFQSGYGAAMAIANAIQIFITIRILEYVLERFNRRFGC